MAPSEQARRRWRRTVLAAAVLLAACADVADGPLPGRSVATSTPTATSAPVMPSPTVSSAPATPAPAAPATPAPTEPEETATMTAPGLQRIVDLAVADLASRTGVAADDIVVVTAETVTWPDAGLGCPQPGRRYAQVPQDGARVHLRADGRLYRYHTGGQVTVPFLCEQPAKQREARSPDPRLRLPGER